MSKGTAGSTYGSQGTISNRPSRVEAIRAMQQGEPYIYCLTTGFGAMKIGISRDVARRCSSGIRYGRIDRLLAFRPGSLAEEQAIHDRLAPFALPYEREYYYPTNEVIDVAYWVAEHFDLSRLTSGDFPDLARIAPIAEAMVAARAA